MNWSPFLIGPRFVKPPRTRPIETSQGVGDRLRTAAFAELQARESFRMAAARFGDAPSWLRQAWLSLAAEEDKHLGWFLGRMKEMSAPIEERWVSEDLWISFLNTCCAARFCHYMAEAEERGRVAGTRFRDALSKSDPVSAQIFGKVAQEEEGHIKIARRGFEELIARRPGFATVDPGKVICCPEGHASFFRDSWVRLRPETQSAGEAP